MTFVDEYLPPHVPGYPCISSPRFKTSIVVTSGGDENRNREWEHPLYKFTMPEGVRKWEVVQALRDYWLALGGPECSFPWSDRLDFASCDLDRPNVTPAIALDDQLLGTGDGFTDTWQLIKRYTVGGQSYVRQITLPVLSTVMIAKDGELLDPSTYTVSRPGGQVQIDLPPANGALLTAGYLFDVPVRFESDDAFDAILRAMRTGGFSELTLVEVRPC